MRDNDSIILENLYKQVISLKESFDFEEWHKRIDDIKQYMVNEFLKNPKGKWKLIQVPAERFKKIWLEFGKYDRITDLNGLDKIAENLLNGIASLEIANQLQGHSQNSYYDLFEEVLGWDKEETDKHVNEEDLYDWFVIDDDIGEFLSDYGPSSLLKLVPKISDEENPRDRLMAIDQAMNVIHQRGDLAKFFISGGSKTLMDIFKQGGLWQGETP